jgi:hypothetical protein
MLKKNKATNIKTVYPWFIIPADINIPAITPKNQLVTNVIPTEFSESLT